MNVFDLHAGVLADYRDFVRSYFTIADERARAYVDRALDQEAGLWPDFLLQVSPSYRRVATVNEHADEGKLHRETARIFSTPSTRARQAMPRGGNCGTTRPASCSPTA